MQFAQIKIMGIFILLIFIITNSAYAQPDQAKTYDKKGDSFLEKNNYKDAIDAYSISIKYDPNNAVVYVKRGIANFRLNNSQEAISDFDKVIEIAPKDLRSLVSAYFLRGECNMKLGNSDQAMKDFDNVLSIDPKNYSAYYNKACLYSLAKNITEACNALKKSIELGYNHWNHIKKDSDIDNIRNSSCYKEIMSANNQPSFTFLGIGENDDYATAIKKLSKKFEVVSSKDAYNGPGYDPGVVQKWSKGFTTLENIHKQYSNTFLDMAPSVKGMTLKVEISPIDETMYLSPFNRGQNTYRSSIVFSGLGQKKIMRMNILFKKDFLKDVFNQLTKKYGPPIKAAPSAGKRVVYYWESENDVMLLVINDNYLFDYEGNYYHAPDDMSQIVIQFGKNISEWSKELVPILVKLGENKKDAENKKRQKAVSDF